MAERDIFSLDQVQNSQGVWLCFFFKCSIALRDGTNLDLSSDAGLTEFRNSQGLSLLLVITACTMGSHC